MFDLGLGLSPLLALLPAMHFLLADRAVHCTSSLENQRLDLGGWRSITCDD